MVHSSFDVAPAATEPSTVIQWPPPWSPNMRYQPTADGRPLSPKSNGSSNTAACGLSFDLIWKRHNVNPGR